MMQQVIGKCSLCGGSVTVPTAWYGIIPPTPTCDNCKATQKSSLPVIEMEKTVTINNLIANTSDKKEG